MSGNRQIGENIRKMIVADRKKGHSFAQIARAYELSKSGARKIVLKCDKFNTVRDLAGRGRKRKTTVREDHRILREAKKNCTISASEIVRNCDLNVSARTVRRRLNEVGLGSHFQKKKPLISKRNKFKRLAFAKKYISRPHSFWNKVLWSDESKFELIGGQQRKRVWRNQNDGLQQRYTSNTVKHGGGSIMVWGSFSTKGVGELHWIKERMTGAVYTAVLDEALPLSLEKLGLNRQFMLQQDNDPKHTSKVAQEYFKRKRISVLEWAPQSPDMNPIENLWSIFKRQLPRYNRLSKQECFNTIKSAWNAIDPELTKSLVESMPRRLQAVIDAKGGPTKY